MWCSLAEPRQGRWIWEDDTVDPHDMPNDFNCATMVEMREHVVAHINAGDDVPSRCLREIDEDIARGSPWDDPEYTG